MTYLVCRYVDFVVTMCRCCGGDVLMWWCDVQVCKCGGDGL